MTLHLKIMWLCCCLAFVPSASAVTLYREGVPRAAIVIAPDAPEPVRRAADELARWLSRSFPGSEWPIVTAPGTEKIPIFLGDSNWARERGFAPQTIRPDGFQLKVTPEYVMIAGRDYPGGPLPGLIHPQRIQEVWNPELKLNAFGEMGTLNGVCRFLERFAGIRWYMTTPLGTVVPERKTLEVPELDESVAPDFEYRYAWFCNFPGAAEDALWYRRVGFGAPTPVCIIHNYSEMLSQQKTHPEYFALIDGKRDFSNRSVMSGGGNLCLSNPDLIQAWIDRICTYFAANPAQELYPLCPMDGMFRICGCAECQAQLSPELGENGRFSNYVWTFSDRVARGVAERCPGKMVGTFAYEGYQAPPTAPAELAPNLAVMICYNRQCLTVPEQKKKIRTLIARWGEQTETLYFWTYPIFDYWLPWRGFPRFYPQLLQEDLRANRALGSRGEFLESEFRMPNDQQVKHQRIAYPGLTHLTAYLTVKLMWDADTDIPALLNEYYRDFYGTAAGPMRRFWEKAELLTMTRPGDHPVKVYTPADIREFFALLDEAARLVPAGNPEAQRIALIRGEMEPFATRLLNLIDAKRPLTAPLLREPLRPDWDLLHSPWRRAARYKFAGKDGSPSAFTTYALVAADEEGLGVTFLCFEPEMTKLTQRTTEHDTGAVWDDDSVELLFCREDGSNGRIFIVNAAGNLYDGAWEKSDAVTDVRWNSTAYKAARRLDDRWLVQIKIPWRDLGVSAETAGDLRLNFYRNRVIGGPTQFSAFTPTMLHQHRAPEFFGPLVLQPEKMDSSTQVDRKQDQTR